MNKKFKGQGALEYLLLIGGAVLIAVIVIALLVGMGNQSRESVSDSADAAARATDLPQPAIISSVTARAADCDNTTGEASLTFSWTPLTEGGSHEVIVRSRNVDLNVLNVSEGEVDNLDPNNLSNIKIDLNKLQRADGISENFTIYNCGDTYTLHVITRKNDNSVTSQGKSFSWSGQ